MTECEKLIRNESEAIECLRSNKPTSSYLMLQESVDMAIQALEKQIPMKPVRKLRSGMGNDYRDYYCSCGMFIGYEPRVRNYLESGTPPFSYCCNCGQKFDWSDDNDD